MTLDELITEIKDKQNHRELSDEYLATYGSPTHGDVEMCAEWDYGITYVQTVQVLPFLEELAALKEKYRWQKQSEEPAQQDLDRFAAKRKLKEA